MTSDKVLKYQWVRGDNMGTSETFDKQDNEWIYFKSGRRISHELLNEYMILEDHNGPMDIPSLGVTTVNFTQDDDNYSEANKKSIHPSDLLKDKKTEIKVNQPIQQVIKKEISPIKLLLNKSTKDEIEVTFNYKIKLPKKGVYEIIKDSFDVDIDQEILDIINSEIDINIVKSIFEEQILLKIKSHFKK